MNEKDLKLCDKSITYTLDILTSEKRFMMGGFAYQNLEVERIKDFGRHELLYSVRTLIPAENLKEETHTITVEYPETWWQAFKEQYFSAWLKKKCSVRYKKKSETVKVTAYNLYPQFPRFTPERCEGAVQTICKLVAYQEEGTK